MSNYINANLPMPSRIQMESLYDLYNFTNGQNWIWLPPNPYGISWNFTNGSNPCYDWQGISCSCNFQPRTYDSYYYIDDAIHRNASGDCCNITQISLINHNLVGTIPSSMAKFESLRNLHLSNNRLVGSVPPIFESLEYLYILDLCSNELTGPIPNELGQMNLEILCLGRNKLSGTIPPSLGNLSILKTLDLNQNRLSGTIPSSFGSLTNLIDLGLYNTKHLNGTIPASLGNLTNLVYLRLNVNELSGTIPSSLGGLTNLVELYLERNQLFGTLPSSLGHLKKLTSLELNNNHLNGTIPSSLGDLTNLEYMYLNGNQLYSTIPSSFGGLTNLKIIYLSSNDLFGTIPSSFGDLTNLIDLGLYNTKHLNGTIPASLGNLTNLVYLRLNVNELSGTIPSSLGNLTKLDELYLERNRLFGTLPSSLGSLTSLRLLRLVYNQLSGSMPSSLGRLIYLKDINLSSNQFSGTIPSSLGDLTNLISLRLYVNQLSGTIPSSFGNLHFNLTYLDLNSNRLSGMIHSSLGGLTNLGILYLYSNQLSGTIPSSLSRLAKLSSLYLNSNHFHGSMPSTFSNLSNLQFLNLSTNLIHGTIPSSMGMLSNLQDLYLDLNFIDGSIPSSFGMLSNLLHMYLSQNLLTGCLPVQLSHCFKLQYLEADSNFLTGTMPSEYSRLPLVYVFLNDNSISGSLSPYLFTNPTLQVLSLSSNCFGGSFPACDSIHYSDSILTLYLSDLSSGVGCRKYPLGFDRSLGFYPSSYISGGVPSCIFDLRNITALYLSGNGLAGSLEVPSGWDCRSSGLRSLAVSANQLDGSIPVEIQRCGEFDWLDLSSNRFSGSLDSGFMIRDQRSASAELFVGLSVNRLSGALPWSSSLSSLGASIIENMLVGNMFTFSVSQVSRSMDSNGSSQLSSHKGSSSLDIVLMVCLSVYVLCVCIYSLYHCLVVFQAIRSRFDKYSRMSRHPSTVGAYELLLKFQRHGFQVSTILILAFSCGLLCLKCVPCFSSLKTQQNQYAWILSVCFLNGWPAILMVIVLISMYYLWLVQSLSLSLNLRKYISESLIELQQIKGAAFNWKIFLLIILNICVMMGMNVVYLVVFLTQGLEIWLFQFLLGAFKGGWNLMMFTMGRQVLRSQRSVYWYSLLVLTFNMVLSPCLSTFLTESACLYPLFKPFSIPSSAIEIRGCIEYDPFPKCSKVGPIQKHMPDLISPFIYNYRCASALIVDFVPVILYSVLLSSVVWPSMQMSVVMMDEMGCIPRDHRLIMSQLLPLLIVEHSSPSSELLDSEAISCVVVLQVNLLILLTFGLACPYLGISIVLGLIIRLSIFICLSQRYVYQSSSSDRSMSDSYRESQRSPSQSFRQSELELSLLSIPLGLLDQLEPGTDQQESSGTDLPPPLLDLSCSMSASLQLFSLLIGLFWAFQSFDMVGGVHGSQMGQASFLCVCIFFSVYSLLLLEIKSARRGSDMALISSSDVIREQELKI